MYERFFGFSEKPFSLLPDAHFLYPSKRHKRVMNLLEYGTVNQSGFMVITGDVGAGKTTIIRHYLKGLGNDVVVGVITNPSREFGNLLNWVAAAFDLDSEASKVLSYNHFINFLLAQYAKGKRTILIVDEAQNLSAEALEELRMLSNVNNERDQLLQIILVGQPELLETLKRPDLRQFVQRIAVHCHLTPLDPHETAAYIHHRVTIVGGNVGLFDDWACAAIHYFTYGVPRLINLLCDQALMYAFAEDQKTVNFRVVAEVVSDRGAGGLSAFRPIPYEQTEAALVKELQAILQQIRRPPTSRLQAVAI